MAPLSQDNAFWKHLAVRRPYGAELPCLPDAETVQRLISSGRTQVSDLRRHIAFIDIGLPGMDGYAIAHTLKDDRLTAAISLIALTGYGSDNDRLRAAEAGFERHFTKPIRLEDLQLALA